MAYSRRKFLRRSGSIIGASAVLSGFGHIGLFNALAQSADYKALVCIFLYGGNDSNNMVIPNGTDGYQAYANVRGRLAIAQNSLLPIQPSSTGSRFGLHPSLSELHALWSQRKLAVLCNVGTLLEPTNRNQIQIGTAKLPDQLFSHEDQQNQGQTAISDRIVDTGWGGRVADRILSLNGTATFPMVISTAGDNLFISGAQSLSLAIDPANGFPLEGFDTTPESMSRYQALRKALQIDTGHNLVAATSTITNRALDAEKSLSQALALPLATPFPQTSLGGQLKGIARLIAARGILGLKRQIFFCAQDGYDTHSDQLSSHVDLYTELSGAMNAFYQATVELGVSSQVTTFTLSDFGRTFKPNTSGTDHAWGSHHFIMGGSVRGGDFYGTYPTLALAGPDDTDEEGRWIPTTAIDQYAATLAQWYGISRGDLPIVVPQIGRFSSSNLGFMS